jgi:hypothetical protein
LDLLVLYGYDAAAITPNRLPAEMTHGSGVSIVPTRCLLVSE